MRKKTVAQRKTKPTIEKHMVYLLDGEPVSYTLRYKKVKNFNLRVQDENVFSVSVPHETPDASIQRFLDAHVDFLRKALQAQRARKRPWHIPLREQILQDGTNLSLLDQPVLLRILADEPVGKAHLMIEHHADGSETWWVHPGRCNSAEKREQTIANLVISEEIRRLEQAVKENLPQISEKIVRAASELDISREMTSNNPYMRYVISPAKIHFRDMSSRWGSCMVQKGSICLNSRLIFAPASCLHYVLCHELSHFIYADHSTAFYRLLQQAMPDALMIREKLQGNFVEK